MAKKKKASARPLLADSSPPSSAPLSPVFSSTLSSFILPQRPKVDPTAPLNQPKLSKREMTRRNRNRDVVQEFERYFGTTSKLENWQRLCRDVGIDDDLPSLNKCRQALKKVWVNIYDLLDAVEAGTCPPTRYPSQRALREYTRKTNRIFPKKSAKEGGPVRALLVHIF